MPLRFRENGWSGGQYSLFRMALGLYLLVHFAQLVPWGKEVFSSEGALPDGSASPLLHLFPNVLALWDGPVFVTAFLAIAVLFSGFFIAGYGDRPAAVVLWYILACLNGRNPLIANPSLPFLGWILLAHSFLPRAPYGSWSARSRTDPAAGWRMPPALFAAAWVVMSVAYTYSGYTKLVSPSWLDGTALERILLNPLARPTFLRDAILSLPHEALHLGTWLALGMELLFAPLALLRRARPWIWYLMLVMHVGLLLLIDFSDLTLGMILLHLFTFNPEWIRPLAATTETLFYDGNCGLCHGLVRFVIAEDRAGTAFRFAPQQGKAFRAAVRSDGGAELPNSVVVRTEDGSLLTRSAAVLHILMRLGGYWRLIGYLVAAIPSGVGDLIYAAVARTRYRLFGRPSDTCPLLPPGLHQRFEDI